MTRPTDAYRKIGLTGGIGSGKSTVARRLAALGAHVYDADEIARHALDPGSECYQSAIKTFGQQIVGQNGEIDRKRLSQIVFSNPERLNALNQIIHPYVIDELFSRAERDLGAQSDKIAVFEVPLLYESGLDSRMDKTILVVSDEENRIRRVIQRSGLTRQEVRARIHAQMPDEEKRLRADYILENNDTEEALIESVDSLFSALQPEVLD